MKDSVKKSKILDINAAYYGYPMEKLMEQAAKGIAEIIEKKFKPPKKIAFFCGPGNNGGDGFAAARYLDKKYSIKVYLTHPKQKIKTQEAKINYKKFQGFKQDNVDPKNIPADFDIIVECLLGTGIKGKLKSPYSEIIKKLNQLKAKKISIDVPAPGFNWDLNISLMTAKTPDSLVVDLKIPPKIKNKIGPGEVKTLTKPEKKSHKGQNGEILVIAGGEKYHGAALLCLKTASKIADLVYFYSNSFSKELLNKVKTKLFEFIAIQNKELDKTLNRVDSILIGPGLDRTKENKLLINKTLENYKSKKIILDAEALKMLSKKKLHKNCVLTPHAKEFENLFSQKANKNNCFKMAKKFDCVIILKGKIDYVANKKNIKENHKGNAGMTKGGTGDVLAGLIAAFCSGNDPFYAACAAVFVNGLAGDRLKEKVSYYYNASDLIQEIPKTIKYCKNL
ncbi:MAG: NAD(P)H-hydrate dehydratase [Candidatus Moranbacteria bacterium]|nr:NAD(P)H-hydrate dehydratase [Candidatus Moranbacteria bacterium]